MKVLHIGKYFPPHFGGIESFMSQLMEQQAIQGLSVMALVHADRMQSKKRQYHWKGCEIIEVRSFGQLLFVPIAPTYPFILIRTLKTYEPDVLHIHMPNVAPFWLLFTKRLFANECKIITHWHSDVLGASPTKLVRLFYPIYRVFERSLLATSDKVIVTSPAYLQTSIPLISFHNKCEIIPLGIKIGQYSASPTESPKSPTLKLIMIGRLTYYKGHKLTLNALAILKRQGIDFKMAIVGKGKLRSHLKNLASDLQLEENVTWTGSISEVEKSKLLNNSDLLLLPSLERTEAFGVVLLEAASHHTPSLVTDVPGSGMSYVIDDNINGFIVAYNNLESLVEKLTHISNNKHLCLHTGNNAFAKLQREFDIKIITDRINALYASLK